jgi:hypothetical protein
MSTNVYDNKMKGKSCYRIFDSKTKSSITYSQDPPSACYVKGIHPLLAIKEKQTLLQLDATTDISNILASYGILLDPFLLYLRAAYVLVGPCLIICTCLGVEIWTDIKKCEGYFEVSNLGVIRSVDRWVACSTGIRFAAGIILKTELTKKGYVRVRVSISDRRRTIVVHLAVLEALFQTGR